MPMDTVFDSGRVERLQRRYYTRERTTVTEIIIIVEKFVDIRRASSRRKHTSVSNNIRENQTFATGWTTILLSIKNHRLGSGPQIGHTFQVVGELVMMADIFYQICNVRVIEGQSFMKLVTLEINQRPRVVKT
jgi:hypothetical protein